MMMKSLILIGVVPARLTNFFDCLEIHHRFRGTMKGGRIGLGMDNTTVSLPRQVQIHDDKGAALKAVDVDAGYVHSLIVGLNGTVHLCGNVGIDGANDGQVAEEDETEATKQPSEYNNRLPYVVD